MKRQLPCLILSAAAALFLSCGLQAQEQVEVSVKVKKNGEVVKDTTYMFDDASEAKQAIKMMDLMTGDEEHMDHVTYNYTTAHTGSGAAKTMVFISEDGEQTEITEFSGDSAIWVSEEDVDGDHVKVMKYKIDEGDHADAKKEINVVISGDEEGNWTVVESDENMMDKDVNVKVVVITEAGDEDHVHDVDSDHEEEIEVKVVKKKEKK